MRTILLSLLIFPLLSTNVLWPRQAPTQERGITVHIKAEDGREVRLYDKSHALVVGVGDYTAGWPKLPGVKGDVEAVSAALERHGFQVTLVMNPDSTQLDKSFKEFISVNGRNVNNRLLFYFAGHGHTVKQSYGEEMGYIVPADAPNPNRDPNGFLDKAMGMRQMELYAESIQAKHALFLFDSCFSGALFAITRAVPESISYKTARHVRQFITSGSADEQVPDQSVFRRQFVEALEGEADGNKDGYVTGTELGEFLQDKVVNYTRNAQHPQYGKIRNPNLDKGDFVFALPRKAAPPAVAVKPDAAGSLAPTRVDQTAVELAFWDTIKNSTDPEDFKAYLKEYPDGRFASLAKLRAQPPAPKLTEKAAAPPPSGGDEAAKPTDKSPGYDDFIARAVAALSSKDWDSGIAYARQAVQLDPSQPTAYALLGVTLLYGKNDVAGAEQATRAAVERGGPARFVVFHDHDGNFNSYCQGVFFVTKTGVSFKADDGVHTFEVADSGIREAKMNGLVGAGIGAFHIKPIQKINGKDNFNFAPGTKNKAESKLIITLIQAY